jgi:hypothetical protein
VNNDRHIASPVAVVAIDQQRETTASVTELSVQESDGELVKK